MRRLLAAVLVAMLLAVGCGDGDEPVGPGSSAPATDTKDTVPPALDFVDPVAGAWVTTATYTFTGTTEPGARVVADSQYPAEVELDGAWSVDLTLDLGRNAVSFTAADIAGNETVREIQVFYEIPMSELIVGSWIGDVTVPRGWQPITDFWVEFRADGSYSADAAGESPFHFGYPNADYPEKVFAVDGHYPDGQPGSGWIDIVWDDEGSVTTTRGSLENISFSDDGDRLEFEFWATWGNRQGPIVYDLRREILPPGSTSTTTTSTTTTSPEPTVTTTSLPPSTTSPPSTTVSPSATPLTFSGLSSGPFGSYTESGFTVSQTTGSWEVVTTYGNPAPFIQFFSDQSTVAEIEVSAGGSVFVFNSVDLYSSTTPIPYTIRGMRDSRTVFTMGGTEPNTFGAFAAVTNPEVDTLVDRLTIELTNSSTIGPNPMGLDNIVVSAQ